MFSRDRDKIKSEATIPTHVAIIMDGNGRWASKRFMPRFEGHRRGVEALRRTIEAASALGIPYLTLYSFSSENWSRPRAEVDYLLELVKRFVRKDLADLHARNVRVRIIGEKDGIDNELAGLFRETEELTRLNTGLTVVFAFNYGSRQEITAAVRTLAQRVRDGEIDPAEITPDHISACLDTYGIPDPDLVIRTSGEQRLSNFLLWQAAYAEFIFMPLFWPDFDRNALEAAIAEFASRERRFGNVNAQSSLQVTSG